MKISAALGALLFAVGAVYLQWRKVYLFLLAAGPMLLSSLWRLRGPRKRVAVSPTRVMIFGRSAQPETYFLQQIARANWSWIDGGIEILGHEGRLVAHISYLLLYSHRHSKRLAALIDRRAKEYASRARAEKTPSDRPSETGAADGGPAAPT